MVKSRRRFGPHLSRRLLLRRLLTSRELSKYLKIHSSTVSSNMFLKIWRWIKRPRLSTPSQVFEFTLANFEQLKFEQISELEKAVRTWELKNRRNPTLDERYGMALYGCRLIHPVMTMKDPEKIVLRWSDAMTGKGSKSGIWSVGPSKILDKSRAKWEAVISSAILRAAPQMSEAQITKALGIVYPESQIISSALSEALKSCKPPGKKKQ